MTLKIFANKGHGSTSTGSKPEPYLTKTESRNRRGSGPAHTPNFCYMNTKQACLVVGIYI